MADPKTIAGMVQILGLAELLIGSNVVPALTALFKTHYELTPADQAALDEGLHQLMMAPDDAPELDVDLIAEDDDDATARDETQPLDGATCTRHLCALTARREERR
jgi:hypothetical protein